MQMGIEGGWALKAGFATKLVMDRNVTSSDPERVPGSCLHGRVRAHHDGTGPKLF